ncbi:MAG: hypothetical protein EOM37_04840 [Proteobacteria bacterium]|jgi:hypothetical protein|nr:hypothetical protein [Alphaproteobacteria bacterium]NCC03359.1 hypothetical protein [Pseudomonadota bacterium]
MAQRDLYHNVAATLSLSPAARVTGTANGTAADLRGFGSAVATVSFGSYTDGTHTPKLQHSDDNVTFTDATATELQGAFAALSGAGGANKVQNVGYIGNKRYVRVVITTTGATTGALSGANIIAGEASQAPTV